jgi:hypothetical protein
MQVVTYSLKSKEGKHIRMATMVICDDGQVIRFTEKMSKRNAMRQAAFQKQYAS